MSFDEIPVLFLPEAGSDVLELTLGVLTIEALVGGGLLQRTKVLDERTYLYIVEVLLIDGGRDDGLATIPSHLELGMLLVDILCQDVDTLGIAVAAHESNAGDILAILFDEGIDGIGVKGETYVLPKVMAMTPRTVTRAIRDVNCQCHFVGYLLKYYASVDVLQHRLVCQGIVAACGLLLTRL